MVGVAVDLGGVGVDHHVGLGGRGLLLQLVGEGVEGLRGLAEGVRALAKIHGDWVHRWHGCPLRRRRLCIPFRPKDTIACLANLYNQYGLGVWKRYGFVDAFNSRTGWTDVDVLGIDQGITLLMAENYRSGLIWVPS